MKTKIIAGIAATVFLLSIVTPVFAQLWPGEGGGSVDLAQFANDPYPIGTSTVTIHYKHDSSGTLYIELYDPASTLVNTWAISSTGENNILYTVSDTDGVWKLKYYMTGGGTWDSALFHTFAISDPQPEQDNLESDWARHPQDTAIYQKALSIIGQAVTSYGAAYLIYNHVVTHFQHNASFIDFNNDTNLLNDLNTKGKYVGVCRSDAVILTAYARALGIPARIIHLQAFPVGKIIPPGMDPLEGDPHYFAEFYILSASSYEWFPVDGDPLYNWFGLSQANQRISEEWPEFRMIVPPNCFEAWNIAISIVTNIPHQGIIDEGYTQVNYPNHPYRNDL